MRYLLVFGVFLLFGQYAYAGNPAPPDSAKYKWVKGEKYLLHKVRPKETWNSIARKYQMSISDVMRANMGVIDLKAGQILNIPAALIHAEEKSGGPSGTAPSPSGESTGAAVYYTVRAGETLYGISKKFETSVDNLKAWNHLKGDIVREGEKIIVGHAGSRGSAQAVSPPAGESAEQTDETAIAAAAAEPVEYTREVTPLGKARGGKKLSKVSETGICSWISDGSVNQSKFYALHRTAPAGTIIKVTNKMNDQHVFVKVVGVLPDTGDNRNSIIKISEAAVKKLGALDKQFLVELTYGITN
jgi:LysM repeat protein